MQVTQTGKYLGIVISREEIMQVLAGFGPVFTTDSTGACTRINLIESLHGETGTGIEFCIDPEMVRLMKSR